MDNILFLSSDVADFAFTKFTVDSLHPLSPVHTTTIGVACRISTCLRHHFVGCPPFTVSPQFLFAGFFSLSVVHFKVKRQPVH